MNTHNIYRLLVKNTGLSTAYEIKVSTSPTIRIDLPTGISGAIPFIEHTIPTLLPSSSLESAFVVGFDSLKAMSQEMRFTISLEYSDEEGTNYKSTQKIDVRLIADAAILKQKTAGEKVANEIRDAVNVLVKAIDRTKLDEVRETTT